MLADYWVIAILLIQICALSLLTSALRHSTMMLYQWNPQNYDSRQLSLERENYLISAIIQGVLWLQIAGLFLFLQTVNTHLPGIIKGAMCATGALGVNDYGYGLLWLKISSLFVYVIYLTLNFLDNQQPDYPLTPQKYWLIFPVFGLVCLDLIGLIQYFRHIRPDIIATCCSVDFQAIDPLHYQNPNSLYSVSNALILFGGLFGVILLLYFFRITRRNRWISLAFLGLLGLYVGVAIFTLKYFFVKYIYGLPSHLCLFDIFWAKYYYIGFALFGTYLGILLTGLAQAIVLFFRHRLTHYPILFMHRLHIIQGVCLVVSGVLPFLYWFLWRGAL
jgi:hypothetical protein